MNNLKYTVSYSNLLLNTMLDTMKRQNRRTIDGEDIVNFERELNSIIKQYNLPVDFKSIQDTKQFLIEIEPYVYITNQDSYPNFTLLPWIGEEELEKVCKNTIFENMDFVYNVTKENLRFKRDIRCVERLRNIGREVNKKLLKSTIDNISFYEQQKTIETSKLQKIKKNLNLRG